MSLGARKKRYISTRGVRLNLHVADPLSRRRATVACGARICWRIVNDLHNLFCKDSGTKNAKSRCTEIWKSRRKNKLFFNTVQYFATLQTHYYRSMTQTSTSPKILFLIPQITHKWHTKVSKIYVLFPVSKNPTKMTPHKTNKAAHKQLQIWTHAPKTTNPTAYKSSSHFPPNQPSIQNEMLFLALSTFGRHDR